MGQQASPSFEPIRDITTPIILQPKLYWMWVECVKVFVSKGKRPLNSQNNIYPIVFRFYKPDPQAITKPNPAVHISYLKRAGCLLRFGAKYGRNTFWIPETDIIIQVAGKIVYTPDDLSALLSGDERFVFSSTIEGDEQAEPEEEFDPAFVEEIEPEMSIKSKEDLIAEYEQLKIVCATQKEAQLQWQAQNNKLFDEIETLRQQLELLAAELFNHEQKKPNETAEIEQELLLAQYAIDHYDDLLRLLTLQDPNERLM